MNKDIKKKIERERRRKANFFDGRFFEKRYEGSDLYLDEEQHIQEQTDSEEEEFEIKVSEHRRDQ